MLFHVAAILFCKEDIRTITLGDVKKEAPDGAFGSALDCYDAPYRRPPFAGGLFFYACFQVSIVYIVIFFARISKIQSTDFYFLMFLVGDFAKG